MQRHFARDVATACFDTDRFERRLSEIVITTCTDCISS
jgi:hypothetical protein